MQYEKTTLSIINAFSEQITKYSNILLKKSQLRIKFNRSIISCKPGSLALIWQLIDIIPEENILFSYYNDDDSAFIQERLKEILSLKEKGNKIIATPEEALMSYNEAIKKINEIEHQSDRSAHKASSARHSEALKEQKKLITSNKAHAYTKLKRYQEAIECDMMIINSLDNLFDKSYARVIVNYIEAQDLDSASLYATKLKNNFSSDICSKYNDIFDRLKEEEAKTNMRLKSLARNNHKKQKHYQEEVYAQLKLKQKERRDESRSSLLYNVTLFVASGIGLFLLYKYKSHYS